MTIELRENLTDLDRTMRVIIGIGICLAILLMPFESVWIATFSIAAMYPLLSGLTAIDPLFAIVENISSDSLVEIKP